MFFQITPVLPTHPQPVPPLQPLTVPDVMGQTGLVQVVLNHSQFAQSLQTGAFKEGMGKRATVRAEERARPGCHHPQTGTRMAGALWK